MLDQRLADSGLPNTITSMAKAGFWLRGSRGKLAGASMAKGANGQTIIREIVTPKNPQTQAQMIQRVIMKTIMTAYSRMKEITDHSFEGISPGRDTMAEFMRINLNALRENVAVQIANGQGLDDIYAFTPLKSETFAPNAYIIAKGSLPIVSSVVNRSPGYTASVEGITGNTYGDVINSLGLQRGDQLTFISIQGTTPQNTEFFYARVILDPRNADGTEAPLTNAFIDGGAIVLPNPRNEGTFDTLTFDTNKISFGFNRRPMLDSGVVVSRRDASGLWKRSDCTLNIDDANIAMFNSIGECLSLLESEDIQTTGGRYLNQAGRARTATFESQNTYTTVADDGIEGVVLVGIKDTEVAAENVSHESVGNKPFVVAVDDQGNEYFIKNGNSEQQAYDLYMQKRDGWGDFGSGADCAWSNYTPTSASAQNTLNLVENSGSFMQWLETQGATLTIWLVQD